MRLFSKSSRGLLLPVLSFSFSVQCMWSFFQCKEDSATCTRKHDDCVQGNDCEYIFKKYSTSRDRTVDSATAESQNRVL
jgi:hypothetical protein